MVQASGMGVSGVGVGDLLLVRQWRSWPKAVFFKAKALSDPFQEDGETWIDVESDTGYAVWNTEEACWDDGEY